MIVAALFCLSLLGVTYGQQNGSADRSNGGTEKPDRSTKTDTSKQESGCKTTERGWSIDIGGVKAGDRTVGTKCNSDSKGSRENSGTRGKKN